MRAIPFAAVAAVLVVQQLAPSPAAAETFTNPTPIVIVGLGPQGPANTPATPYPSNIVVSGMSGTVTDVNVTLNGLDCSDVGNDFAYPEDFDILLQSPSGDNAVIYSDVGGNNLASPPLQFPAINVTLDDQAAQPLPADSQLSAGTYRPLDDDDDPEELVPEDAWPASGPLQPGDPPPSQFITPSGSTALSTFNGEVPNGTWSLYVVDDYPGPDNCEIDAGWTLDILTTGGGGPTTTSTSQATTTSTTTGANQDPVAVNDAYTTAQGVPLTVTAPGVLANDSDPDGDALTADMPSTPANGTLLLSNNGGFTYTPNAGFSGTDTFTYMAHDPHGGMDTATVTINVTPAATTTTSTPATTTTSTPATTTTSTPATTTTSTPATTTTSTPASTTTTAPAPGGPIQIDDLVLSDGNVARVTGTINCEAGHRFRMRVDLIQGDTEGRAMINGTCTGEPQRFRAIVQRQRGPGFEEGTASVRATGQVGDPDTREIVDRFQTTEDVDIDIPGTMMAAMLQAAADTENS